MPVKHLVPLCLFLLTNGIVSATEIIHLADYHYVSPEDFAVSVRTNHPEATDAEIAAEYGEFLNDVEQIQIQQMDSLRKLIKERKIRTVYVEGFTRPISEMKWVQHLKKPARKPVNGFDQFMVEQRKHDLLAIGAAGKLFLAGELENVFPCETLASLKAADPIKDEKVELDHEQIEARENQMVSRLLQSGEEVIVIVLGEGHDLGNNVPGGVTVRRVVVSPIPKEHVKPLE